MSYQWVKNHGYKPPVAGMHPQLHPKWLDTEENDVFRHWLKHLVPTLGQNHVITEEHPTKPKLKQFLGGQMSKDGKIRRKKDIASKIGI